MRSRFLIVAFLFIFFIHLHAQKKSPAAASVILQTAMDAAAKENKNVMVIFSASWCGWCHKMLASINDPVCKPFFDANYKIAKLSVLESEKNKSLENPGADSLLAKYKGEKSGIPFWLVYDSKGNLLATSMIDDNKNTGCPASKPEVDYFLSVLKKTAKTDEKIVTVIANRFRKNEE